MENTKNAPILEIDHDVFVKGIDILVRLIGPKPKYTCIVPIPRGGFVPATYLSHRLNLPIKSIDGPFHEDEVILFVEDVVDTGETLDRLQKDGILSSVDDVATIVFKSWSTVIPKFWALNTDRWVHFPWEV